MVSGLSHPLAWPVLLHETPLREATVPSWPRACSTPATMRLPLLLLVAFLEFHCSGPFQVRLSGGPSACVGRVEISHKGRWGSVCDDEWDLADAAVVCRQLGCGTALSAPVGAWFGEGTGPIWLNEMRCQGSEQHLRHCRHRGWRQHVCTHEEDASAVCSGGAPLRLVGGPHNCAGRLEVLHKGQWGSVCDDGWGLPEGAVVCRELGCGAVQAAPGGAHFGTGTGPIWLDDVGCSGKEVSLRHCRARPWGRSNCQHNEDASVVCTGGAVLRLVGGAGPCSGRLEVFHQDRWGTVCDDMWALPGAAVVCRELGCGDPLSAPGGAFFGEGSGPIWLDNVRCQGNESALSRCPAAPWGVHDCQHAEDAGVVCTDEFAHVGQRSGKPMAPQPRTQKPRMQKPRPRPPSMAPAQVSPRAVLPGKWKPSLFLEPSRPREAAPPEVNTRRPPPSEPELPTAGPTAQAATDAAVGVSSPRDTPRPGRHGAPRAPHPVLKSRRPRPKPLETRPDAVRHRAPAATPTLRTRTGAQTDPHLPRLPHRPGDSTLVTVASPIHLPSQPHKAWTSPGTHPTTLSTSPTTTYPPSQPHSAWTSPRSLPLTLTTTFPPSEPHSAWTSPRFLPLTPTTTFPPSQPHSTWTSPRFLPLTPTTTFPPSQPHSTWTSPRSLPLTRTTTYPPSQPHSTWTSPRSLPLTPTTTYPPSQPHSTWTSPHSLPLTPTTTYLPSQPHSAWTNPGAPAHTPASITTFPLDQPHSPQMGQSSPSSTTAHPSRYPHNTQVGLASPTLFPILTVTDRAQTDPRSPIPTAVQSVEKTHSTWLGPASTFPSYATSQPPSQPHSTQMGPAPSRPTTSQPQDETHTVQMDPAPSSLAIAQLWDETQSAWTGSVPSRPTIPQPQDETQSAGTGPAPSRPTTPQPQDETHRAWTGPAPSRPTTPQPQDETQSAGTGPAPSRLTTPQPQDETHRAWTGHAPSRLTTPQPQDETHSAWMGPAASHPTTPQPQDEIHSAGTGPTPSRPTTPQPQDETHSAWTGLAASRPTTPQLQDETHSAQMGPTTPQPQDEIHSAWPGPAPSHPTTPQPQDETHSAQTGPAPSRPTTPQPQDETHSALMGTATSLPTTPQPQDNTHSAQTGPAPSRPTTPQPQDETHSALTGTATSLPTTPQPQDNTHSAQTGPAPSRPTTPQPQDETHSAQTGPASLSQIMPPGAHVLCTSSAVNGCAKTPAAPRLPGTQTAQTDAASTPGRPQETMLETPHPSTHPLPVTAFPPATPSAGAPPPPATIPPTSRPPAPPPAHRAVAVPRETKAPVPAAVRQGADCREPSHESPQLQELIQVVRELRGDVRALVHIQRQEGRWLGAIAGSLAELAGAVRQVVGELPRQGLRGQSQLPPSARHRLPKDSLA
ncbi:soluble scavenger receptor cysteine-rich domain-containing protein SSC5D isoform X2 [Pelodiscus sinensis]|uniref:soluble scavenger receptor cysteine-rich domain-containing protein SSC5D isoform X2 n=1 Tax=Pelodiscus sinensis TaxID=13735 RepID=UPI003F6B4F53